MEPKPDVAVINLQETSAVGLIIRLVVHFSPCVDRAWNGSSLQRATAYTADLVRETRVKVTSVLLLGMVPFQTLRLLLTILNESTTVITVLTLAWVLALMGLRVD